MFARIDEDNANEAVRSFYDLHPYPPSVEDLNEYRRQWQDEDRRIADFHLHWPRRPYREDLRVLLAGCGTVASHPVTPRTMDGSWPQRMAGPHSVTAA